MITNYQIADVFELLSKLMDIHGENAFKSKSYAAAAFQIEKLPLQLAETDPNRIAGLKGIGESNAQKIREILQTGSLQILNDLVARTPSGILEMLSIKGLGPKKIATIWKEMEIESIGELLYACRENRLMLFKGFGQKTQQNVAEAISFYLQHKDIHLYADVESYARSIHNTLVQQFPNVAWHTTGAFRRQLEIIPELEWVTTLSPSELHSFFEANNFTAQETTTNCYACKGPENVLLRFHCTVPETLGSTLFATSCSEAFLEEWGIPVPAATEDEVFAQKGSPFLPPYLREIPGCNPVKDILEPSDIRGIIHCHSNWSDGSNTVEELAAEAQRRGLEYLVLSDHSRSAFYANGLSAERVVQQHLHVNELNERLKGFRIFKSIESDILNDGSLDYDDELLAQFDLVIASVHSNLKMSEEKAMQRLLCAIENPYTTILGHPTGRLLLSRSGYPLNHRTIIDACAANLVAIEINAHPRRLDLDWRWVSYALEKGVYLSVNPDAHALSGFDDTRFGVLTAQKGGLTPDRNLSSFTLAKLEQYLLDVRKEKGI
jgi:DNA polymerase (family 10)